MGGAGIAVRRRILGVLAICVLGLVAIGARLLWVQAVRGRELFRQGLDVRTHVVSIQAPRGEITDSTGQPLAISVGADSVYAVPAQIRDRSATAAALASALGLRESRVAARLAGRVMFVWVARKVTAEQAAAVQKLALPGIHLLQESRRIYPQGMFAAQVLGFVGLDNQGLAGAELSYNKALSGTPGELIVETDARNLDMPGAAARYVPPQPGLTLRLSINATLQSITQRYLDQGVAQAHALGGYAVMMDPDTGAILAMAAWPTFDPNQYASADPSLWTNPLLTYAFSPGSVFKPITASAAMQEGVVTPTTPFDDSGVLRVGGVTISNFNHRGLGPTTFGVGFEKSANTIFGRVGLMLGKERFYNYLRLFGFMNPTSIDLPGESRRPSLIRPEQLATPLDVAEEAFGQTLAVTPISLVTAISAIANGGNLMWPHVGLALIRPNGTIAQRIAPRAVRRVLSPEVAYQVQSLMARVVEAGSGRRAGISCYSIAGKTGTTQKYAAGGGGISGQYIGSFVGYAPAHGARLALYVMIDEPQGVYYGGQVAAPVFRSIMVEALKYLRLPAACPPGVKPQQVALATPESVAMPSVVGMTPAAAAAAAAESGLYLRIEGSGGTVLRQVPPAGEAVTKWSTVLAYTTPALAIPEPTVTVPDLRGMNLTAAAAALSLQGLQLQGQGSGVVIAQSPPPGASLHPGDTVQVTFASRP